MASEKRQRAVRTSDNDVSHQRYILYKEAFGWINKSIENGFYLEAISLEESLISDRLESYLIWLTNQNFSFKTLGHLQKAIEKHSRDRTLRSLVLNDLDAWRQARNKAAHEMVKIEDGNKADWSERVKINLTIAQTGLELVRKIEQQTRKLRSGSSTK